MKRSAPKKHPPVRDWDDARAKVHLEGQCRKCGAMDVALEAAHVIGRKLDKLNAYGQPHTTGTKTSSSERPTWHVHSSRIVPLCQPCHALYDSHEIDLLPVLFLHEQMQAVRDCGGIEAARRRVAPLAYREGLS